MILNPNGTSPIYDGNFRSSFSQNVEGGATLTRDTSIDVARGLAIFIMIPANMSAVSYADPHPLWFRIFSSLAAPLFIFIAGMMVASSSVRRHYGLSHFAIRAGLLLIVGTLIDLLIWGIVPFNSFDILYFIGIATPLTFLLTRLQPKVQLIAIALVIVASPAMQHLFGYAEKLSEPLLSGTTGRALSSNSERTGPLHHLFIDGWFPLVPWLAIMWVGALVAQRFLASTADGGYRKVRNLGLVLVSIGIPVWIYSPGAHYLRDGYSELFYPPTPGFLLTALGFNCIVIWTVRFPHAAALSAPLRFLGESALFIYIIQCALIVFLINPYFVRCSLVLFTLINFVTLAFLVITAFGLRQLKQRWAQRPLIIRFFVG
jgi:Predicted membrane protein